MNEGIRNVGRQRQSIAVAILVLIMALAACTPGATLRVSLSPGVVPLVLGGQAQVEVTVTRAGTAGDLTLLASGLPSGVAAQFAPAVLAGAAQTSTLTLSAAPGATQGTTTVTVTVSGVGLAASDTFELTVDALAVTGLVKGAIGQPIPGVTVMIEGHGSTTTAADGTFEIDDVAVPYVLTVLDPVAKWAHTFRGLSVAAPELFPITSLSSPQAVPSATVSGDLGAPVLADRRTIVCVEGLDAPAYGCATVSEGATSYSIPVIWREGMSAEVRLRALEYSMDALSFDPTAITGATASTTFTVTEGGATDVDLVMGGAVAPANFTATVNPAFPADSFNAGAMTHLTARFTLGLTGFGSATNSLSVFTPFFSGSTYTLFAGAVDAAGGSSVQWRTGVTQGASLEFEPPTPPFLTSPADGATGIGQSTVFTVGNTAGGVLTYQFLPSVAGPSFAITTTETSVAIPDLSAAGLPLPAASDYYWSVYSSPETLDMSAAVTGLGYLGAYVETAYALSYGGPAPSADGILAASATRNFTTQ